MKPNSRAHNFLLEEALHCYKVYNFIMMFSLADVFGKCNMYSPTSRCKRAVASYDYASGWLLIFVPLIDIYRTPILSIYTIEFGVVMTDQTDIKEAFWH